MNKYIVITTIAGTFCLTALAPQKSFAGTLYQGWNYALDSFNDGVSGDIIGPQGAFEFYSLAIKEEDNNLFIALNANLPLTGDPNPNVTNSSIAWGDLFFNFSGQNFLSASDNNQLFAVRFSAANDSTVPELGVYQNVTAKSVTTENSGFISLEQYNNTVTNGGGVATMADLAINNPYWEYTGSNNILNSIATGEKIGEINFLDSATQTLLGLDFAHFNAAGSHTIAFSASKDLFPSGDFIAHVLAECANDGMALQGQLATQPLPEEESKDVPESSTPISLLGLGLVILNRGLRKEP
ncbi:MAG: XDD3 family exosortase-dependent surface protein [Spirulinaceae cyanobacterium]